MERFTDCAQGYCEMYCKKYMLCFEDPEDCAFKDEIKLYDAIKSIEGIVPFDRLLELACADKAGRLVALPCKVGDRVWVTRAYGKPFDAPREGHVRKFVVHDDELVFLEALIWMDLGEGKNEYGYGTESFGKIVHLTRDAAEAAMAQKGGKDHA